MIAIYGAGIAGTFLAERLRDKFDIEIYDVREDPDCRCAWGIDLRHASKHSPIDLDDYILNIVEEAEIIVGSKKFIVKIKDVAIIDRKRLLSDLWRDLGVHHPSDHPSDSRASLIVDATGCSRAILPPIKNDNRVACIQSLVDCTEERMRFILDKEAQGYAWAFPCGKYTHIGAGGKLDLYQEMRSEYDACSICKCEACVRLLPPSKCKPIIHNNVMGVGESIGCVNELGGGINPSIECAEIAADCIINNKINKYEKMVGKLRLEYGYKMLDAFREGSYVKMMLFRLLIKRKKIPMTNAINILKTLKKK